MPVEATIRNAKMQEQAKVANTLFKQERFDEAFKEYLKMAESHSIGAQVMVGWMYHTGRGVKMNMDDARYWYLIAAESNSPEAQFYLGRLYAQEEKYQDAISCFRESAMQNYIPAIYQMGMMYALGEGVDRNKEEAYKYYEQASKLGHLMSQREIGMMMVRGYKGVKKIPQGILILAQMLYNGVRLILKDPEDDRLRW